jgi:elongin-C
MDDETDVRYVKLVSAEGLEFFLDREVARAHSGTLRKMLDSQFKEATDNIIMLPEMSGHILEGVVFYLHYKQQYSNATGRIPEYVRSLSRLGFNLSLHFYCLLIVALTGDRTRSSHGNASCGKVSRLLVVLGKRPRQP